MLRNASLLLFLVVTLTSRTTLADEALNKIVKTEPGFCLIVGDITVGGVVSLAASTRKTIVIQLAELKTVRALQVALAESHLLGSQVYVSQFENGHLCLADNLATVVVDRTAGFNADELLRAARPRGRVVQGDRITKKPVPAGTGEWTHPYHDAANNPMAEDKLAKAPYLTKFLATPHFGPMPEITLSSGGRLFKAFGHLAFKEREWPMLGKLVAFDAYNGVRLWEHKMEPGFMIHRNTIVATPETIYLADHISCKLIDTATGKIKDEIKVPEGISDGPVWKWMTIKNGVLYALVGEKERLHTVHKGTRGERGWPWGTVKATYSDAMKSWGFGRTLLAMDLKSRKLLWTKREKQPIDSRATSMSGDRIFVLSHAKFLAAIDTKNGQDVWRTDSAAVLDAIGAHDPADNPRLGYSTSSYMKSTNDVIFFAGPQRKKLVAVSAKNGQLLWSYDDGNMQLIIRKDGLYAMGRMQTSKKFDPLTGEILADLKCFRGNCTRATGTVDSIFTRGYRHTGTMRFDVEDKQPHRIPSMRPACQDGVLASNGQLYWGPWMCDCNHSLVGIISLQNAGDFDFNSQASSSKNLRVDSTFRNLDTVTVTDKDWPTYRGNNQRTSSTSVEIPAKVRVAWTLSTQSRKQPTISSLQGARRGSPDPAVSDARRGSPDPTVSDARRGSPDPAVSDARRGSPDPAVWATTTPAIAVADTLYVGAGDGVIRAVNTKTGKPRWSFATDGRIFYPPTYASGRILAGSADGWVYALNAATGESLWRFRAAPTERRIPVYGKLSSTWPVASGVLVENGVAYAAAGIASHDGTYVYALDVKTGKIKWQNTESDNLIEGDEVTGVSVQGHLLFHNNRIYMAGGNVVSPAIFDAGTGKCLNKLSGESPDSLDTHWQMQRSSRGSELFLNGNAVVAGGRMLYSEKQDGISSRYNTNYALQASHQGFVIRGNGKVIECIDPKQQDKKLASVWKRSWFESSDAIVATKNAIVVAGQMQDANQGRKIVPAILALDIEDGTVLWSHLLPQRVVSWGLAVDREGRIIITLANGDLACLAADSAKQ